MSHFSRWFQDSLSFSSLIIMCHDVGLLVYSAWSSFVLGCLHSYLASNLGCFSALDFSSDFFFHFSNCTFQLPNFFFFKYLLSKKKKKNKAKQFAVSFIVSSILLRQLLKISFGSFVYQFEHLFQTNLFLVPMGSTGGPDSKESTCNAGDLGWKDSLEESVATHSSILAWRIPMDIGLQRAGHEWATKYGYHLFFLYLFIRYSSCWLLLSFPSLYALWVFVVDNWTLASYGCNSEDTVLAINQGLQGGGFLFLMFLECFFPVYWHEM